MQNDESLFEAYYPMKHTVTNHMYTFYKIIPTVNKNCKKKHKFARKIYNHYNIDKTKKFDQKVD